MFDREAFVELVGGGGSPTVPCLRIKGSSGDVRWLYESLDIIAFLKERYAKDDGYSD